MKPKEKPKHEKLYPYWGNGDSDLTGRMVAIYWDVNQQISAVITGKPKDYVVSYIVNATKSAADWVHANLPVNTLDEAKAVAEVLMRFERM